VLGKQLFGITVWAQKTLFEKIILISLLGRVFCKINIIIQKFEIITPNTI